MPTTRISVAAIVSKSIRGSASAMGPRGISGAVPSLSILAEGGNLISATRPQAHHQCLLLGSPVTTCICSQMLLGLPSWMLSLDRLRSDFVCRTMLPYGRPQERKAGALTLYLHFPDHVQCPSFAIHLRRLRLSRLQPTGPRDESSTWRSYIVHQCPHRREIIKQSDLPVVDLLSQVFINLSHGFLSRRLPLVSH